MIAPDPSSWDTLFRVVTLQDYNTRVVVLGTMLLGLAAGVVGTFMLLRKRALIGDALSHATLPGIGIAFLVMVHFGGTGKFLPGLLAGAVVFGLLGVGAILFIKSMTRIKEDAALGIVLSVFFGLGIVLLRIIQKMPTGNQAGLESFIYGKTASMLQSDAILLGATALGAVSVCTLLFKEFSILSFDGEYAAAQGWPVVKLDVIMMVLVTAVTVIGLQAVGLILIIAMLIIPPAAARFWTNHLRWLLVVAGVFGAVSGLVGGAISALAPRLPAGAIIVVVAAFIMLLSILFGAKRGVLVRAFTRMALARSVRRQHLLRAMYEWGEEHGETRPQGLGEGESIGVPYAAILEERSWTAAQLDRVLGRARRRGLVERTSDTATVYRLTADGRASAARAVRNHRLWEMYLITHADIAPSHVDRDADQIEHVLGPAMVGQLELLLEASGVPGVPPSPHRLAVAAVKGGGS